MSTKVMHAKLLMPGDRKQKTKAANGTQRSELERGGETHKSYTTILDLIRLYRGVVRPFGVRGVCRCEGCELGVCRVCDPYESCGSLSSLGVTTPYPL